MIIVLKAQATKEEKKRIIDKVHSLGLKTMVSEGVERSIIGVIGEEDKLRALIGASANGGRRSVPDLPKAESVARPPSARHAA